MPVITRSFSLREPRRQPSNIGRPTTNNNRSSATTSVGSETAKGSTSVSARATTSTNTSTRQAPRTQCNNIPPSPVDNNNTKPSTAVIGSENVPNRSTTTTKSLLPQRSLSLLGRDRHGQGTSGTGTARSRVQEQQHQQQQQARTRTRSRAYTTQSIQKESLHQPQPQQQQQQLKRQKDQQLKEQTIADHRKSLVVRPAELRIPSSSSSSKVTAVSTVRGHVGSPSPSPSLLSPRKSQLQLASGKAMGGLPASPRKMEMPPPSPLSPRKSQPQLAFSKTMAPPTSPRKAEMMPPPPRPARSVSVKQPPVGSGSGSLNPAGSASLLRRPSQVQISARAGQTTGQTGRQKTEPVSSSRIRPRFTTFQQSFSPKKKTVKPPTPTTPATVSDSVESEPLSIPSSSWPELEALQMELLQLNLLHSSYLQRSTEWQTDAEASLRKKYDSVAGTYRSVLAEEKETQRRLNFQALAIWLQNTCENHSPAGHDFAEQIQTLSSIVQEVSDLSDRSGRYTRAIQVFEDWFRKADRIRRYRDRLDYEKSEEEEEGLFVDPLGNTWKQELYALTTKLELCARQLQSLDILGFEMDEACRLNDDNNNNKNNNDSALLRLLMCLGYMITMMIDEVNAIRMIEGDIVRCEREWVTQRTEELTATVSSLKPREDRVGIWKMVSR